MMKSNEATLRQIEAADPLVSTWVSANAGSGKTRVLTDRVARLLLEGVVPENILCLTYTKAAASEMQNRLFARLGSWAMMPDQELQNDLSALGALDFGSEKTLTNARRLFAKAIETPGGLKIQTIHSFCASLLRRFPLEARVSPQFVEMEERAAQMLRSEVVEEMAKGNLQHLVDDMATVYANDDIERLATEISKHSKILEKTSSDSIWSTFGLTKHARDTDRLKIAFNGSEIEWWSGALECLGNQSATYQKIAKDWKSIDLGAPTFTDLSMLSAKLLDKADQWSPKLGRFPQANHKKVREAFADFIPEIEAFMERLALAKQHELKMETIRHSQILTRFAQAFLPLYEAKKTARSWLDFDDLIHKAQALLTDPAVAQWVLFRLDGGIDHILVDEAQDTSPVQWQVIEQLAREFTTGQSARSDVQRTLFVVGDPKQSIYSFQGADPDGFEQMREYFQSKLLEIEEPFQSLQMEFSFRSSPAILDVVDRTFDPVEGDALIPEMKHRAFKSNLAGRVDLWPVTESPEKEDPSAWSDPLDRLSKQDSAVVLADQIASHIRTMIENKVPVPHPDIQGSFQPAQPKDFLILVQRRNAIFHQIIRACKSAGLPIAGADRLKIGGELAVKDITAVLRFLSTPEDSLSLACALKSPLFGLNEQDIFDLSYKREDRYLWAHLRKSEEQYPAVMTVLGDLRKQADFLRPYELIERLLTRHGGRKALISRLGKEAEDGIDALLDQALSYERTEVPSLTGFLIWLDSDEVEIKRQIDSASDQIRVMTVHGAKGLEAPIVILPDTAKRAVTIHDNIIPIDGHAIWKPPADCVPERMQKALQLRKASEKQERLRLLYVAMTRAEKWLIVCASGEVGDDPDDSWYGQIKRGLIDAGAQDREELGLRFEFGDWSPALEPVSSASKNTVLLEPFYSNAVQPSAIQDKILTPTDLPGPKALASELGEADQETAKRFGTLVHKLLEVLPLFDVHDRNRCIQTIRDNNKDFDRFEEAVTQSVTVLSDQNLQPAFNEQALTEVDLSAHLPNLDGRRLRGTVDRLIVTENEAWAIDYKTNAAVPSSVSQVPLGILRQMGAYHDALKQVFPDKSIRLSIIWTANADLMDIPHDIVSGLLKETPTS